MKLWALVLGGWLLAALPAAALEAPQGPVVLTVTGGIAVTNSAEGLAFDQAALDALPQTIVRTETPWTEGMVEFSGVSLKDLLNVAGAKGRTLIATALNDYAVEIPVSDADNPHVIIAARRNGALMPVRDKGPLWIIYPLSDEPALQNETTNSRMIWQLNRLEIK
ncbi:molybdopterin-dependent oxidoreductase [Dongia sp.]|jgi:hypothetical protein|uniref:molybdopterin-dependent oxidoreductase n=1 Tax=Dongia sp. TaxID=1977262 RepID=UPI0035B2588F